MPPIVKKMPPIKKHFQIPLTHLHPFAPKYKKCPQLQKMPPIEKTFSNSTNPFAPNFPQLPPI